MCGPAPNSRLLLQRLRARGRLGLSEHQRAIVDGAETQRQHVLGVVLVQLPRDLGALLGHHILRALEVAGGQRRRGIRGDGGIAVVRRAVGIALAIHLVEDAAEIFGGEIRLQGPRRVGIAESRRQVRHIGKHHALVAQGLAQIGRHAVDHDLRAAHQLHLQPGGGDDDVGRELLAGAQLEPLLGEALDLVGDHGGLAGADRLEEIAVGHQAEPLVPRIVARGEMLLDVDVRPEFGFRHPDDHLLGAFGFAPRGVVEIHLQQDVLPASQPMRETLGQFGVHPVGDLVLRRPRHDVGGRALQHRDMGGGVRHRRHQRHRRGAAADHHHALAVVGEVLRPLLRMHDGAAEPLHARPARHIATVVIVIAAAHLQEIAGQGQRAPIGPGDVHGPPRIRRRPRRPAHAMAEVDLLVDAVFGGGLIEIVQDRRPVGDRLLAAPGPETIAERVHVRIRTNAGIAKQIPGAADGVARLENGKALVRAVALQVIGDADAGNASADDKHIMMGLIGQSRNRARLERNHPRRLLRRSGNTAR